MIEYVFIRDVSPSDWIALPRAFSRGETVRRGSDSFGLCRDDMRLGGIETVPCSLGEKVGSFEKMFTVPVNMLRTPDGKQVVGDYI